MSAVAAPLAQYAALAAQTGHTVWLAFADPCGLVGHPGWFLRNLLVLAKAQLGLRTVSVLCYRENPGKGDISRSIVLDVDLGDNPELAIGAPCPKAVGWEKNEQDKLQPRSLDLAPMMDPIRCAAARGPCRPRALALALTFL